MRLTGGKFRGRKLLTPQGDHIRPTTDKVRVALFNLLEQGRSLQLTLTGQAVLDLFCGTGALGLEALSRGAACCTFVDRDKEALTLCRRNTDGMEGVRVLTLDAAQPGIRPGNVQAATLVFSDPPYRQGLVEQAMRGAVTGGWLARTGVWAAETETGWTGAAPEGFVLLDRRDYSGTLLSLYQWDL